MIYWKCSSCGKQSFYEGDLILKFCARCNGNMILTEEKTLEAIQNGL